MQNTTTIEEELILAIATHPHLHKKCWEMIANADDKGLALERALAKVFPVETRVCRQNVFKKEVFWRNVLDCLERGSFKKAATPTTPATKQPLPLPVKQSTSLSVERPRLPLMKHPSNQTRKKLPRHPLLENLLWDEDAVFCDPPPVDNYLLMSHTS